ncbi:MAG: aminotransferase class I/II-fold pyridoxal phosphate-dependent enzyme [Candidatus Bathyarchaeia archaeon]
MRVPQPTARVREIEYAIRDVAIHARRLEKAGHKIIYLNIGDPVAFDFPTPDHIKAALLKAVQEDFNAYSSSEGLPELREAIAAKEKRVNNVDIAPEDVVLTNGVSEGIQMLMAALVDEGDEVLLPSPTYPPYAAYVKFFGGRPVFYKTLEESGWKPDVEDLRRKISPRTVGIVIINPNNPTGSLYDAASVKFIADTAGEAGVPIISDEIYDRIIFDGRLVSAASVAGDVPVVGLNGFSKAYLMTGWRLGYIYFHNPNGVLTDMRENILKEARIRLCANTPVQRAAVAALNGPQTHIPALAHKLRERRDHALKLLSEIPGVSCAKPDGAFYMFPRVDGIGSVWKDDKDFVFSFLEKAHVLVVHGSGFHVLGESKHFRSTFLPPIETLNAALEKLASFMKPCR